MTGRLIVVGDSFAILAGAQDPFLNWCQQAATLLDRPLVLLAGAGVSQDWQWAQLNHIWPTITPEDRVLVVLTHCERQWYIEGQPTLTHVATVNLTDSVGPAVAEAIRQSMMHLQRPQLDLQHQAHRLGWLHSQVHRTGVHSVWILPAFGLHWHTHGISASWEEFVRDFLIEGLSGMHISPHNLMDHVQLQEMTVGVDTNQVFCGVDTRYNHMCRDNHSVLAQCVAEAIQEDRPINLNHSGWLTRVLSPHIWHNKEFVAAQMDPYGVKRREHLVGNQGESFLQNAWRKNWGSWNG